MEFIRGFHNLRKSQHGCVATLGNLDGLHLGHQALLAYARQKAEALALPAVVVTFEPLPREYFARLNHTPVPARLTRLRDKVALLADSDIDRLVCLHFNKTLRQFSAESFVNEVLVASLGVRYLVVGDDFRFGCDRKGDFALLVKMGQLHGFAVTSLPTLQIGGQRVSSSRIRECLAAHDLDQANALLGRAYSISGKVVRGDQLGRQLGVPTANINIGYYTLALSGVYAVTIEGLGATRQGVANLGVRPTVAGLPKPVLEVHLFDFDEEIYGREIKVVFHRYLRAEQKFNSLDELKIQIHTDIEAAKKYFDK